MRYAVEVTRQNDHSVSEDLGEMMAWLKNVGIQPQGLARQTNRQRARCV
jgi:hypothetical protein